MLTCDFRLLKPNVQPTVCLTDPNECICILSVCHVLCLRVYYRCSFAGQVCHTQINSQQLSCHGNKASILNHRSVRTCPRTVHHCCARPFLPTTSRSICSISATPNIIFQSDVDIFSRPFSFNS